VRLGGGSWVEGVNVSNRRHRKTHPISLGYACPNPRQVGALDEIGPIPRAFFTVPASSSPECSVDSQATTKFS
jgi:hypothetical protein